MRWERFFDDLEDQLASEWEAERAALDSEAERLRLAHVALRERIAALAGGGPVARAPVFEFCDGACVTGAVTGVAADWLALAVASAGPGVVIAPLRAIATVALGHAEVLRTARGHPGPPRLAERITFGFALRDLARRRVGVRVHTTTGRLLTGTIDRAGADHFDLALHDSGSPRRAADVTGHRLVSMGVVVRIEVDGTALSL